MIEQANVDFKFDAESLSMAVPVGQCVLEDALL